VLHAGARKASTAARAAASSAKVIADDVAYRLVVPFCRMGPSARAASVVGTMAPLGWNAHPRRESGLMSRGTPAPALNSTQVPPKSASVSSPFPARSAAAGSAVGMGMRGAVVVVAGATVVLAPAVVVVAPGAAVVVDSPPSSPPQPAASSAPSTTNISPQRLEEAIGSIY
jgi:hypothetical protein